MIPDYQTCMLPLLKFASDEKIHTVQDAVIHIAEIFNLTEEEKQQMLPSGLQSVIFNRVGWARTYLKKAGLLEDPKRGTFKITKRGLDLLKENISELNVKYLNRYEEFVAFRNKRNEKNKNENISIEEIENNITPEESIEFGFQKLKESISEDIIAGHL